MAQMGFLRQQQKQESIKPEITKDLFIRFDSGAGIDFDEGCHNTIILGSTGSGKTSCAILPALNELLRAGYGGLVIDVKGNLTDQLRSLAANCGREGDIVEYGSESSAIPVNLLGGMDISETQSLFRHMATRVFDGHTNSLDWHEKGVRIATDCLEALRYANEKYPDIRPDIDSVEKLINDYALAARFWKTVNELLDSKNKDHVRFRSIIEQEQFHPLSYDPKKGNNFMEQATWRLGAIRNGLDAFQKAPGIRKNFAANTTERIDLKRLIYDKKRVVALRFGVGAGEVGAWLSRHVLERFYQVTFEKGLSLCNGEHTFLIADEAQEYVDLSPSNRLNDNSFASKAREYRVIQVVGTQSVAALSRRGAGLAAVSEYLNNFNNRIVMYCDDSITKEMVAHNIPGAMTAEMGPGQCAVSRFDLGTRRHVSSMECLQQSHDAIQSVLQDTPVTNVMRMESTRAEDEPEQDLFDAMEQMSKERSIKEEETAIEREEMIQQTARGKVPRGRPSGSKEEAINLDELDSGLKELVELYPHFFKLWRIVGCLQKPQIPAGWVSILGRSLKVINHCKLDLDIKTIGIFEGCLCVTEAFTGPSRVGLDLCNKLLQVSQEFCPFCGVRIMQQDGKWNYSGFCEKCLEQNDLHGQWVFEPDQEFTPKFVRVNGL